MAGDHNEDPYPVSCPFCTIAKEYPSLESSPSVSSDAERLKSFVPVNVDAEKVDPNCHLVLAAPEVMAFLDIMPMTPGHLLITSRSHRVKVEDLPGREAQDIGFWLPILAKAVMNTIDCTDYNLVQNNGESVPYFQDSPQSNSSKCPRAGQVVGHVHFHIIPRPDNLPNIQSKSWTMFGRGQRDDLDDDDASKLAEEIRRQTRKEIDRKFHQRSLI